MSAQDPVPIVTSSDDFVHIGAQFESLNSTDLETDTKLKRVNGMSGRTHDSSQDAPRSYRVMTRAQDVSREGPWNHVGVVKSHDGEKKEDGGGDEIDDDDEEE